MATAACECGVVSCKGELTCQYCGVPDEYARYPKDWFMTCMGGGHNKIRIICYLCVSYYREEGRRTQARPIPKAPWMK